MIPMEMVRRLYGAWDRDDFETFRASLHPDVEWHSSGRFPGLEPVYHGPDGVRDWWVAVKEPFEEWTIELERVREVEGWLVAEVRFHAVGKESGVAVDLPFAHVFEFEGELIRRYWSEDSVERALAAARG